MKTLVQWVKINSIILVNAGSLVGTTTVTSILGVAYWWFAARRFSPEVVGIASASVSAMMLLGSLCMLGLGTLLLTEIPRQSEQATSLINTALLVVGGVGGGSGILFAIVAPYISASFLPLKANIVDVVNFAAGSSFTAITLVLDQALIGLLRGELQFWRNTLFAVAKLVTLLVASLLLSNITGMTIYATWTLGNAISLTALALFAIFKCGRPIRAYLPQWRLVRLLAPAALRHHLLNLTLQVPTLALPVMVTVLLSAKMNAWFYISWMIANFVFIVPAALTTVLHTMNSAQQSTLAHKAKMTISLAFVMSLLVNCLLQLDPKLILNLFGTSYADLAAWNLRILALGAFPLIIKNHYISICRIHDRILFATRGMLLGCFLELGAATLGAHLSGLTGLSFGWVIAISIEALIMLPTIYKNIWAREASLNKDYLGTRSAWLIETAIMPAVDPSYLGARLIETPKMSVPRNGHIRIESNRSKERITKDGKAWGDYYSDERSRLKPLRLQPVTRCNNASHTKDTSGTYKIVSIDIKRHG